jgi:hypothetical protein
MLNALNHYYFDKEEPLKSYLLALRTWILKFDSNLEEAWKYGMPFFCYKGKMLCYLWIHKKTGQPYIGIVEGKKIDHPALILEKRARMKIMMLDPEKDIPVKTISTILKQASKFY